MCKNVYYQIHPKRKLSAFPKCFSKLEILFASHRGSLTAAEIKIGPFSSRGMQTDLLLLPFVLDGTLCASQTPLHDYLCVAVLYENWFRRFPGRCWSLVTATFPWGLFPRGFLQATSSLGISTEEQIFQADGPAPFRSWSTRVMGAPPLPFLCQPP